MEPSSPVETPLQLPQVLATTRGGVPSPVEATSTLLVHVPGETPSGARPGATAIEVFKRVRISGTMFSDQDDEEHPSGHVAQRFKIARDSARVSSPHLSSLETDEKRSPPPRLES
jgi:hypothetical protein